MADGDSGARAGRPSIHVVPTDDTAPARHDGDVRGAEWRRRRSATADRLWDAWTSHRWWEDRIGDELDMPLGQVVVVLSLLGVAGGFDGMGIEMLWAILDDECFSDDAVLIEHIAVSAFALGASWAAGLPLTDTELQRRRRAPAPVRRATPRVS